MKILFSKKNQEIKIPYYLTSTDEKIPIFYKGCEPFCSFCKKDGHWRSGCNEIADLRSNRLINPNIQPKIHFNFTGSEMGNLGPLVDRNDILKTKNKIINSNVLIDDRADSGSSNAPKNIEVCHQEHTQNVEKVPPTTINHPPKTAPEGPMGTPKNFEKKDQEISEGLKVLDKLLQISKAKNKASEDAKKLALKKHAEAGRAKISENDPISGVIFPQSSFSNANNSIEKLQISKIKTVSTYVDYAPLLTPNFDLMDPNPMELEGVKEPRIKTEADYFKPLPQDQLNSDDSEISMQLESNCNAFDSV
ncbi:hypothetical protein AYI68_g7184 [Smittium mucronatum]|uniref:CCHC-type domain-containing protein n=1 Tax=Smittium mucronatum TaxID=133383 RepID=A0A1R0GPC9_9FUNG|nr:hypothetical protein AYI68_g7184 [Smittium mucronatum]